MLTCTSIWACSHPAKVRCVSSLRSCATGPTGAHLNNLTRKQKPVRRQHSKLVNLKQMKVKLTKTQRRVLENGASGRNDRGMWRWSFKEGGTYEDVTSTVRALEKRGLVELSYYTGGTGGMYVNDAGRAALVKDRLEYLRQELRAERISTGELVELQSLAAHIGPDDVELLEAAGVPEKQDEDKTFAVTLLCEVGIVDVQATDEIAAEKEAIANHPHLRVIMMRVQGKGVDTGYYAPEKAATKGGAL